MTTSEIRDAILEANATERSRRARQWRFLIPLGIVIGLLLTFAAFAYVANSDARSKAASVRLDREIEDAFKDRR